MKTFQERDIDLSQIRLELIELNIRVANGNVIKLLIAFLLLGIWVTILAK